MEDKIRGDDFLTDEELMLKVAAGEADYLNELIRRYEKSLFNFIYRFLGNRAASEDIFQETFLRIFRAADRYYPKAKFSTYAYKIATNLCINELKRKKRRRYVQLKEETNITSDDDNTGYSEWLKDEGELPDEHLARTQKEQVIREAILELPEAHRIAIILSIYDGLQYDEIARICNCSVGTIKSRVFRAKKNLMEKLSHHELF